MRPAATVAAMKRLVNAVPPGVEVWTGGASSKAFARELAAAGAVVLADVSAFEARLGLAMPLA